MTTTDSFGVGVRKLRRLFCLCATIGALIAATLAVITPGVGQAAIPYDKIESPDPTDQLFGHDLAVDGDIAVIGAPGDIGAGGGTGAAYVLTQAVTGEWSIAQELVPSTAGLDNYGQFVTIDGSTIAVRSNTNVTVFRESGGVWTEEEVIATPSQNSGLSVSGTTLAVGRRAAGVGGLTGVGVVDMYELAGGVWSLDVTLEPSAPKTSGFFGTSLEIQNDRLLVGAAGQAGVTEPGEAYIFDRAGGVWTEQAILVPASGVRTVGRRVALDGSTAVLGAFQDTGAGVAGSGAAYVFTEAGGAWTEQAELTMPLPDNSGLFGASVDVLGGRVAVGAARGDSGNNGRVEIFDLIAGTWTNTGRLTGADIAFQDQLGISVGLTADSLLSGAHFDDNSNGTDAGAVYAFPLPAGLEASTHPSVAISGGYAAIGNPATGTVWALSFDRASGQWVVDDTITDAVTEEFGASVALLGPALAIGSPNRNDGAGAVDLFLRGAGGSFTFVTTFAGANSGDRVGSAVALSDPAPPGFTTTNGTMFLAVGAPGDDTTGAGAGAVTVHAVQTAPPAGLNLIDTLLGTAEGDAFGSSVAINPTSTELWVGAPFSNLAATNGGAVEHFAYNSSTTTFEPDGPALVNAALGANALFGASIDASGPILGVSAPGAGADGDTQFYDTSGAAPSLVADVPSTGRGVAVSGDLAVASGSPSDPTLLLSDNGGGAWTSFGSLSPVAAGPWSSVDASGSSIIAAFGSGVGATAWTDVAAAYVTAVPNQPSDEKLTDIVGAAEDLFGYAVDIDGDTAVVAAVSRDVGEQLDRGAVYVYTSTGGDGGFVGLPQVIQEPTGPQWLGRSLALDGDVLVTGANNEIRVYERTGTTFAPTATFTPAGLNINQIGQLAVSGDTIVAGSYTNDIAGTDAGAVHVFQKSGGTWSEVGGSPLLGSQPGDFMGFSVAIDGDLLFAGAPRGSETATTPGSVYLFTRGSSTGPFLQVGGGDWPLTGPSGSPDLFGKNLAAADGALAVAAEIDPTGGGSAGAVYGYQLSGTAPTLTASIIGLGGEKLGRDVDIADGVIVAGGKASGLAYTFDLADGALLDTYTPDDFEVGDNFGNAVAITEGTALLGAVNEDEGGFNAGAAYVFGVSDPSPPPPPPPAVDDATLAVDISAGTGSVQLGLTPISVNALAPSSADGFGGGNSTIADTSLSVIDANLDTAGGASGSDELLDSTTVVDLGLNGDLLDSVLLTDVTIDGGWEAVLSGTVYDNVPLQNISIGDVIDADLIDGRSMSTLDLSGTPIGSIPIGSIALAQTPIGSIPLGDGQDWCTVLAQVAPTYSCTSTSLANDSLVDLAIQGVPIGSIPIGSIPIGSIPIGSIPIGSIPIGSIDVEGTPIGSIPIGSIPIGSIPIGSIPIGSIPIGSIPIGSIPIGSIPIGSIPIGSIALGDLNSGQIAASPIGSIPIGSIPIGSIPIGSIPIGSIPIGSIPIGSIPIGSIDVAGAPIGSIPIGSINLAATPIGSIPIGSIPIGSIPIGSIPIGSIPIGSIPIGSIPIGSIPIGSIPIGSIDLSATPIGSIPIGSIPIGSIGATIDCTKIDCGADAGFSLTDAYNAGAIKPGATLAVLEGADTGLRLDDLVGVGGYSAADLEAQASGLGGLTLAGLLTYDDLVLAELSGAPALDATTLADLGTGLSQASWADLLAAVPGLTEADLRAQLTALGIVTVADFTSYEGMTLADLPTSRPEFQNTTILDLVAGLGDVRLDALLDIHPTLDGSDVNWGSLTLSNVNGWSDVTLEELEDYGTTTVAELINALPQSLKDELTFGDLLQAVVGLPTFDWHEIEFASMDLGGAAAQAGFTVGFKVTSTLPNNRTVEIQTTLPIDGDLIAGSATLTAADSGTPSGLTDPRVSGNVVTWDLTNIRPNVRYEIDFDVLPSLELGTSTIEATGTIVGRPQTDSGTASLQIVEALEPNDVIGDSGIRQLTSDTISLSHISSPGDVDLFSVDLVAGQRISLSLGNLAADFDLTLFGPGIDPLIPLPLNPTQLTPTTPPDLDVDATDAGGAAGVDDDIPLQSLPIIALSNSRDLESETIDIEARTGGRYYVQISGYLDSYSDQPYGLYAKTQAPAAPVPCAAQNYSSPGNRGGGVPSSGQMQGVNSIILVNQERMYGKYGSAAATAMSAIDDLVDFTNVQRPDLGITSIVVPIDTVALSGYSALDAASCRPERANDVVSDIASTVRTLRNADPTTDITHITIVGDDDIIPMARLADFTNIANETGYQNTFSAANANSLFGASSGGYFLSDEPYGDVDPILFGDRSFHVTDAALGRMVETPAEIAGQVATFIAFEGQVDPTTAFVSGYDFLSDGAEAIEAELEALPDNTSTQTLISETWDANALINGLFPSGDSPGIAAVNAHFDHFRALPADQNASGSESDLFTTNDLESRVASGDLKASLLFSMGCHSGLSVPDELFGASDERSLDWAQEFARQGAVWVGNTGYGYGETEGVELSERLMTLFAQNLDGSVTVGEALFYAKQLYLGSQQVHYGAFDEKVLEQATLYGIPFYQVGVTIPPPPAPLPPPTTTFPVAGTNLDFSTIQSGPTFTAIPTGEGTVFEAGLPSGDGGTTGEQASPYVPIVPTVSYEVSNVDAQGEPITIIQDALITAITSTEKPGINPDIARPIVDNSTVEIEPNIAEPSSDPDVYVSSYLSPEGPRQEVTVLAGSYADGDFRVFDNIELELIHRPANSTAEGIDPTFVSVDTVVVGSGSSATISIEAEVVDNVPNNVERVLALVVQNPGTNTVWSPVEMVSTGGDRWSGSLPVSGSTIELIVQAMDRNGNVAITSNKGRLYVDHDAGSTAPTSITLTRSPATPTSPPFDTGPVTFSATADGAILDIQIDGGSVVAGNANPSVTLNPANVGDGSHTVTFLAPDGTAATGVVLFDTTAPEATIQAPVAGQSILSGDTSAQVAFTCADAGSGIASCTATMDGSPVAFGAPLPTAPGPHTLAVTATDAVGRTSSAQVTFTITTTPLAITSTGGSPFSGGSASASVAGMFVGSGTHTLSIDWGDGSSCTAAQADCSLVEPTSAGDGTFFGTHNYSTPGDYTIIVTITSATGEVSTTQFTTTACSIIGTSGDDVLNGTNGKDVICGLGGNDILNGGNQDDVLYGGDGDDMLNGDNGKDLLYGGPGADVLNGGNGTDELFGEAGNDTLDGGKSKDDVDGGPGTDSCGDNKDTLVQCE